MKSLQQNKTKMMLEKMFCLADSCWKSSCTCSLFLIRDYSKVSAPLHYTSAEQTQLGLHNLRVLYMH